MVDSILEFLKKGKYAEVIQKENEILNSNNASLYYALFLAYNKDYVNLDFDNILNDEYYNKALNLANRREKAKFSAEFNFYKSLSHSFEIKKLFRYAQYEDINNFSLLFNSITENLNIELNVDEEFYDALDYLMLEGKSDLTVDLNLLTLNILNNKINNKECEEIFNQLILTAINMKTYLSPFKKSDLLTLKEKLLQLKKDYDNKNVVINNPLDEVKSLLKNNEFEQAEKKLKEFLKINSTNSEAYFLALLCELKLNEEDDLYNVVEPIEKNPNFINALKYGDDKEVYKLQNYKEVIKNRYENQENLKIYNDAIKLKELKSYEKAIILFESIIDFKDSKILKEECEKLLNKHYKKIYDEAIVYEIDNLKKNELIPVLSNSIEKLSEIQEYKNSAELIKQYQEAIIKHRKKYFNKTKKFVQTLIVFVLLIAIAIPLILTFSNTRSITFITNGGNQISNMTVKEFNSKKDEIIPVKENRTFAGWYIDPLLTQEYSESFNLKNMTLYAKWAEESAAFNYDIENDKLKISSYSGIEENIIVPDYIGGYKVEIISSYTFNNIAASSIVLPNALKEIDEFAFYDCDNLISLVLPDSINKYKPGIIKNCDNLKSITMPYLPYKLKELINVNDLCLVEEITLTKETELLNYAFENCSSLKSVNFSNSLEKIGDYAFNNCSSLTNIEIPDSVTSMGDKVFLNCSALSKITLPFLDKPLNLLSLEEVTIKTGTVLVQSAFSGCSNLKVVNLPLSLTTIEENAFSNCSSLESIIIPENVTTIGTGAFSNCDSLTNINLSNNIIEIGSSAFYSCDLLDKITIPSSITTIKTDTFSNCSNLKEITLPTSLESIEQNAFYNCGFSSLEIPINVTSIGYNAIGDNSKLTNLTIPFVGNKKDGSGNTYFGYIFGVERANTGMNDIPESLTHVTITNANKIYADSFRSCETLTNINIVSKENKIEENAFIYCSRLENINLSNNIKILGDYCFANCSSLTTINTNNVLSISEIGSYVFNECGNLKQLSFTEELTMIGSFAFYKCNNLNTINFNYNSVSEENLNLTSIAESAFESCINLNNIYLPNSITVLQDSAFENCTSLTSINIPTSISYISSSLFSNTGLKSIIIPENIKEIQASAFSYCLNLESVNLSKSLETIRNGAFSSCSNLKTIYIPISVTTMEYGVFNGCTSLTISCAASELPINWDEEFNGVYSKCPVNWGVWEDAL